MSRYKYKPLDPSKREFRLLHVLPENNQAPDEAIGALPVRCTITHVSLHAAPEYNALSYVWGETSITVPILVDGAEFVASANLEAGLRHLRTKDEVLVIWVDALCINQADILEKNVQLAQWTEIFARAKQVIAWLGPSSENSQLAIKWIRDYGGRSHELNIGDAGGPRLISLLDALDVPGDGSVGQKAMLFAADLREQLSPANSWHADLITSFLKLFTRAYWSRLWIVQDIICASNLIFVCGEETVSDNALYNGLRLLRNFAQYQNLKWNRMVQEPYFLRSSGASLASLASINISRPINMLKVRRVDYAAPLIQHLRTFRFLNTTDPRDKVFALLGISRDAEALGLRADYNQTCEQVYTNTARRLICAGYMDVLSLVQFPKMVPGLQSWVPDLSRTSYRAPLQQRSLERNGPPGSTRLEPTFLTSATKERIIPRRENIIDSNMPLVLSGVRVSEIEHVGMHWKDEAGVGQWLHELQRLSNRIPDMNQTAEYRVQAVWRAAVADQEIRQGARKPRLADEKVQIACKAFKDMDLKHVDEKTLRDVGLSYYCEGLQSVAKGRRPLLAAGGYLGIGPSETQPGDVVFVLLGADVPFIMRRGSYESDRMQIVGEAYLHGVMDGEVMEKNPMIEHIELDSAPGLTVKAPSDQFSVIYESETAGMVFSATNLAVKAPNDQFSATHESDTASMVFSAADSILTDPDGQKSSVTSFPSGSSVAVAQLALDEFVALLLGDGAIGGLCTEALLLGQLPADRLWRNLRRLLKSFAKDLTQEGNEQDQKAAATLFRSRTPYIVNGLRKQLQLSSERGSDSTEHQKSDDQNRQERLEIWLQNELFTEGSNQAILDHDSGDDPARDADETSDISEESEDQCEEEDHPILPALASVITFILRSDSFAKLQQRLHNFIYPSFASELESVVISRDLAQKKTHAGSTETRASLNRLDGLVFDLVSAELDSISIQYEDLCGRWDRMKLRVELTTQRRWDWWPFPRPTFPLPHSSAYICWTCNCGDRRYEIVSINLAQRIERLLLKYKQTRYSAVPHTKTPGNIHLQPILGQGSSVGNMPSGVPNMPRLQANPLPPARGASSIPGANNSSPASFGGNQQNVQVINTLSTEEKVVFLGVKNGDEYAVAEIYVSNMDDDAFFEALREKYNHLRGVFRQYLSYEIYEYCDFVQIDKFRENEFAPSHSRPSFPEHTDSEYDFRPKPPRPVPPIHRHEFTRRFYFCRRGGKPHKHHLNFIPCRKKCRRFPGPSGALERIPKRNRGLDVAGDDREHFWGLLAIEQISYFRVFLYHILVLSGPFIFLWLWLFSWGHVGDLQNASIPFSVLCVLLSMFWFPLIQKP